MNNQKLKQLAADKISAGRFNKKEVIMLNSDHLLYTVGGGAFGDGPCPKLTSCGTYTVCGAKALVY